MRTTFLATFLVFFSIALMAQETLYHTQKDVLYSSNTDSYSQERCQLNFYYPKDEANYTTVIWFHGGGLTGGEKVIPAYLKDKKIAVVGVGYRFSPQAEVKDIIADAAEAVKWTMDHVEHYGGDKKKIIVGGYSAGAYLALMLALDSSYLDKHGISPKEFLGIASFSSQTITHFTARKEKGIKELQPTVDALAPLYWVRKELPNILLITGDRELEMIGRYEENAYLHRMLRLVGNTNVELLELEGYGHAMEYPAFPILMRRIKEWSK